MIIRSVTMTDKAFIVFYFVTYKTKLSFENFKTFAFFYISRIISVFDH